MNILLIGLLVLFILLFFSSACIAVEIPLVHPLEKWMMNQVHLNYPFPYLVQSRDTLRRICNRYGVELENVLKLNPHVLNPNLIYVNQTILLPTPYRPERIKLPDRKMKVLQRKFQEFLANVTAYCHCPRCCGKSPSHKNYKITASGKKVQEFHTIAMDKRFPFGTKVEIYGYKPFEGIVFTVEDRFGRGDHGNKVDVYFSSHAEALRFGRRKLWVRVYEK